MAVWRIPTGWSAGRQNRTVAVLIAGGMLAAAATIAFPTYLVLSVLALVAVVASVAWLPATGLYLLPACVAFGSVLTISLKGMHVGPTDLVVATTAASLALRKVPQVMGGVRRGEVSVAAFIRSARTLWAADKMTVLLVGGLISYIAAIGLSGLVATDHASVAKELIKWLEVTVVVLIGRGVVRTPRQLRGVLWAAIVAGVLEAILGFGQWIFPVTGPGAPADGLRSFGTFAQPNPYAGYINLSLPIALAIVAVAKDARERWVAGGASLLMAGALALADSRGGLLGIATAVGVIAVFALRKETQAALALGIGAPLLAAAWATGLLPATLRDRLLHTLRLDNLSVRGPVTAANFSTMERLAHWVAGLRMFRAHPLLGVGAGNYDAAYPHFTVDPVIWHEGLGHAHNYYINAAAETGLIGLIAYLAVLAAVLVIGWWGARRARRLATSTPDGKRLYAYALGLLAVFVGFAIHNTTDNLYVHGMEVQLGLEIACSLAIWRLTMPSRAESISS